MKIQKALIFLCEKLENLVFPTCCLICGKLTKEILCKECKKEIYEKAIFKIERNRDAEKYFDEHIYIFEYKDKIRNLILDYKFNDKSYLYKIFSKIIIKNEKICGILKKYDIIIPVPIHKNRKNERGYNQSELIAREISRKIPNLEYRNDVVEKIKNTLPQSSLTKKQRKENVQNVYKVINKEKIVNKKVIILDDIYTTGNTVNYIAKILKEKKVKEITVLTIAKD